MRAPSAGWCLEQAAAELGQEQGQVEKYRFLIDMAAKELESEHASLAAMKEELKRLQRLTPQYEQAVQVGFYASAGSSENATCLSRCSS